jgi:Cysteine-rich TM module stress tolerance
MKDKNSTWNGTDLLLLLLNMNAQQKPVAQPEAYTAQTMQTEAVQTVQEPQQDNSWSSLLRLRGGGCVKGCLETICCCCALDAIW